MLERITFAKMRVVTTTLKMTDMTNYLKDISKYNESFLVTLQL